MEINKLELYKKSFVTSLLINIGCTFNLNALKVNGYMPINNPNVGVYYLTDIFPIPFTTYFFSVGDFFLLLSLGYLTYNIRKFLIKK